MASTLYWSSYAVVLSDDPPVDVASMLMRVSPPVGGPRLDPTGVPHAGLPVGSPRLCAAWKSTRPWYFTTGDSPSELELCAFGAVPSDMLPECGADSAELAAASSCGLMQPR